jgi:hypothetical protein
MEDYVVDVVVICQLEDHVVVDDINNLHINRMDCSGSHKYMYRWCIVCSMVVNSNKPNAFARIKVAIDSCAGNVSKHVGGCNTPATLSLMFVTTICFIGS